MKKLIKLLTLAILLGFAVSFGIRNYTQDEINKAEEDEVRTEWVKSAREITTDTIDNNKSLIVSVEDENK